MKRAIAAIVLLLLTGCASAPVEHLPAFPLISDQATIDAVSAQFHAVHDVSAEGDMELVQSSKQHVELDVAMALHPPQEARIRAWKLGQAIFDLTVEPKGVWLLTTGPGAEANRNAALQISAGELAHIFSLLSGSLFDEPGLLLQDDGNSLIVRRERPGEATIVCTVDRTTRTVRQYQLLDNHNSPRLSLTQSAFVEHDGIAWPNQILAVSDGQQIVIHLRDVELNIGLPANAMTPPRRAVRLP